jgi:hypothetical protein
LRKEVGKMKKNQLIEIAKKEAEEYHTKYETSLTLRGLFYILVSKNIIPNTVSSYKRLSAVLAEARYSGSFPWYLLRDSTRRFHYLETTTNYPTRPLTAEEIRKIIEDYIRSYTNVSVNPWDDQNCRIIVVVEKEALGDLVTHFIEEIWKHGVYQLRVIRGYDSATDLHDLANTISYIPENQTPVILQLGDFDPSGEDIVRDFRERLMMLSHRKDIVFEKVAVTIDQIVSLQLPCKPESIEELEKMRKDPRYTNYMRKLKEEAEKNETIRRLIEIYGSSEIRVELDALVALRADDFKQILRKTIEKYFDANIYNTITQKRIQELQKQAERIRKESLDNLRNLSG